MPRNTAEVRRSILAVVCACPGLSAREIAGRISRRMSAARVSTELLRLGDAGHVTRCPREDAQGLSVLTYLPVGGAV